MKNILLNILFTTTLTIIVALPGLAISQQPANSVDIYSGHFSRDGNNESPTRATENNLYIKLFEGQWIATLYLPYPYATTVEPGTITRVLEQAKKQTVAGAYLRGKFGELTELATIHVERYGTLEDRLVFECGSLAPCTIKLNDGFFELIKPGVLNEHIIRYNHVLDK